MGHSIDSATDHHTSRERQPTDVPKLQNTIQDMFLLHSSTFP